MMFLPVSREEMDLLNWPYLDVLIVTGDAYVDHPSFGAAVIGRVLLAAGFKVGILAQPDWKDPEAFKRMGRPRLFCGVTAGNLDSILAHYTAARKKRSDDAFTPGGKSGRRPDFPTVVYTQMLKRVFPGIPVVLGGIEASMRRTAHYDFWENRIKPSILLPSKADALIYGMGEKPIVEIARRLDRGETDFTGIRGTAVLYGASRKLPEDFGCNRLPSCEEMAGSRKKLLETTLMIEKELNPYCGKALVQMHGDRMLVMEPPCEPLSAEELDAVYELPFTGMPHPSYEEEIPAWTMVKDSVTVVRGCAGGCAFCSLGLHQGKFVMSRSRESVLREVKRLAKRPSFRGTVSDLGGPSANLYGCANGLSGKCKGCRRPSCLFPQICSEFKLSANPAVGLYRAVRKLPGVKHVFVNSGIRMDVAVKFPAYIRELVAHHVSGHLKIAPEHIHSDVLKRMRKPSRDVLAEFCRIFDAENEKAGKKQYVVPYFISGFPGCTEYEMSFVENYLEKRRWNLQQVQSFIPLPMTVAAAMYYTGLDYATGRPLSVARSSSGRQMQKEQLLIEKQEAVSRSSEKGKKDSRRTQLRKKDGRPEKETGAREKRTSVSGRGKLNPFKDARDSYGRSGGKKSGPRGKRR